MVIDLRHTPPSFGTQGSLILDTSIASYSTTIFFVIFIYFILQVKPRQETSQRVPPPHQTSGNVVNDNPLISVSSQTKKGRYVNLSFFFIDFRRGYHLPFPKPIPHGVNHLHTAPPSAPAPTWYCHQDIEHMWQPGLWGGTGHPGGGVWRIRRYDNHQDKDLHDGVFSETAQI